MDPLLWLALAAVVTVLLTVLSLITLRGRKEKRENAGAEPAAEADGGQQQQQPPRRARNLRARAAALRRARAEMAGEDVAGADEEPAGVEEEEEVASPFQKIGTKKLRKIKEKAERKAVREQEEAIREDRKKREALREEERKHAESEEVERKKQEKEEEEKVRQEKEKEEHEEYMKLREAFTVEEEGEQAEQEDEARGVQEFIDYIKKEKVVYMENLASEFSLKTEDAIDRVQKLQESGDLTGVIDDRGKFIFISEDELKTVATFVRHRGRVSIAELANSLINLTSSQ